MVVRIRRRRRKMVLFESFWDDAMDFKLFCQTLKKLIRDNDSFTYVYIYIVALNMITFLFKLKEFIILVITLLIILVY